jgi:hypothetical protein
MPNLLGGLLNGTINKDTFMSEERRLSAVL